MKTTSNEILKSVLKFLSILIIAFLLVNCSEDNEPASIFEESASQRIKKKSNDIKTSLQQPTYGWKTLYFTDSTQLGGYRFLFDFENDNTVAMVSDFSTADHTKRKSKYNVVLGSTIKLSFTTKNSIHKLSDSDNAPTSRLRGRGYLGSFEFLYYGKDGDDLIFKANRDLTPVRLTPATKADWDNFGKNYTDLNATMKEDPKKSVFRTLKVGSVLYTFGYNDNTRYVSADTQNATVSADKKNLTFGFGVDAGKIIVKPAIEVGDKKIQELTYDSAKDRFSGMEGSNELVAIYYSNAPAYKLKTRSPLNPGGFLRSGRKHMRINRTNTRYVSRDESSDAFVTFFEKWRDDFKKAVGNRYSISRFYIRDIPTRPYINIYLKRASDNREFSAYYGLRRR